MQEYTREMKRTLLQMLVWGILICGSAYFAGHGWRIPGLVMGITSSIIYCLLLWYRILKSADMPVHKAVFYMRLGWGIRLFFIAIMLFLSLRIPALDFGSAVVGLFTLQIVIISNAVVFVVKNFFNK
ncbi:MAG: hypothetical protein H7X79_08210 [Sporomusaceae bacterium]|nr:hypothetical protein [Sporomusaceae bacterium]